MTANHENARTPGARFDRITRRVLVLLGIYVLLAVAIVVTAIPVLAGRLLSTLDSGSTGPDTSTSEPYTIPATPPAMPDGWMSPPADGGD
jgi:hypothetical protein